MPDLHCAIRFTDEDHSVGAHVVRDCYGHPEDVLSNLAKLSDAVDDLPTPPTPGTVAAQFVVRDTLMMGFHDRGPEQFCDDLTGLVSDESVQGRDVDPDFLRHHSIGEVQDSNTLIWCYEVEVGEEWTIHVSELTRATEGPAADLFEDVLWQFEGALADALAELR